MKLWRWSWLRLIFVCALAWADANAQESAPQESRPLGSPADLAKRASTGGELSPCFDKQSGERSEVRTAEAVESLPTKYRNWLTEDAPYIITSDERFAFLHLRTDQEWNQFIEQFWTRRSPNPDSFDNEFQIEHYRRIAFSDAHFDGDTAGWKSDRGQVYIVFGPPDQPKLESGGDLFGNRREQGYAAVQYPCENWDYRYLEGIGENIELKFSDDGSGNCRLQNMRDQIGPLAIKLGLNSDTAVPNTAERSDEQQLQLYIGLQRPPIVKYKDLEAVAICQLIRDDVPFDYRLEYAKATHGSTLARLVVEIPAEQLSPLIDEGKSSSSYEIFGRLSETNGWVITTFERTAEWDSYGHFDQHGPIESVEIVLEPGSHVLALVVKDVGSGAVGVVRATIDVPGFEHVGRS